MTFDQHVDDVIAEMRAEIRELTASTDGCREHSCIYHGEANRQIRELDQRIAALQAGA